MNRLPFAFSTPLPILIGAIIFVACSATSAQDPAASQAAKKSVDPASANAAAQPARTNLDKEWLAKTAKLYYSSAKAGLTGFDCSIRPDWHMLVASSSNGVAVAEDDPRVVLLNSVKITMHARMKGGSTIEWVADSSPDKPLEQDSTDLLDAMHRTVEQTLEGFLQFWGPFIEASVVPDSVEGLEITHTPTVHTIHAKQGGTELTEVFSGDMVLEQFNVNMSGTSIKFSPAYMPTPQGLLVHGFEAHILLAGAPPDQEQAMKVGIEYQPVDGLTIPLRLNMDVAGTGVLNYAFDGCTANPK
jgi:hypothetical protein